MKANDKRLKNIENHKFKKGQSGNPKGKKPGTKNFATIFKMLANAKIGKDVKDPITGEKRKLTGSEMIVFKMFNMAVKGEGRIDAMKEFIDRTEGKVPDRIKHEGEMTQRVITGEMTEEEARDVYLESIKSSKEKDV